MEIKDNHTCVYCNVNHSDKPTATTIQCKTSEDGKPHGFVPAGDAVLLGQIVEGAATVTIHEDITADEVALLMSAFMDRISTFEHIQRDPSAIMKALMSGISGN